MDNREIIDSNKKLWDARVAGHVASTFYDVPGFLAGACALKQPEVDGLGDVSGQSLLHLQCHFGLDTLSWARRGATVTGVDFSGVAIAKARELAEQAGLEATFVESSIQDLRSNLTGQYDIVFTSYGAFCWLPDLDEWADIACSYLKPGGKICIAEFHPQWYGLNWDNLTIQYPYFNPGHAFEEEFTSSYAGDEKFSPMKEYFYSHSLSELIQALLRNGIQLRKFEEFPFSPYNAFPNMVERAPDQWIPKGTAYGNVAMMFMLLGEKPA
ncbi:MAG: class I SAM-dependent methyltransferase [Bacteroidia bacterium]